MTPASRRALLPKMSRSHVVWASLVGSLTLVGGLLLALEGRGLGVDSSLPLAELASPHQNDLEAIFRATGSTPLSHWRGIVVHHSGSPLGSAKSIAREHEERGYMGLGYHFVIGNGQGAPDGEIHVGARWQKQLPGVHVSGPNAEIYNRDTIGICLIGDGDRRSFTPAQIASLEALVSALEERLGLDDSDVLLGRDVSPTSGPGRLFPEAAFREQLAAVH